jgi:hypothetical protein
MNKENEKHGKAADAFHRSYGFVAGMAHLERILDPIRNRLHGRFPGIGFNLFQAYGEGYDDEFG